MEDGDRADNITWICWNWFVYGKFWGFKNKSILFFFVVGRICTILSSFLPNSLRLPRCGPRSKMTPPSGWTRMLSSCGSTVVPALMMLGTAQKLKHTQWEYGLLWMTGKAYPSSPLGSSWMKRGIQGIWRASYLGSSMAEEPGDWRDRVSSKQVWFNPTILRPNLRRRITL